MKKNLVVGVAVVLSVGAAIKIARAESSPGLSPEEIRAWSDAGVNFNDGEWGSLNITDGEGPAPDLGEPEANSSSFDSIGDRPYIHSSSYSSSYSSRSVETRTGLSQYTYGLNYDAMVPLYVEACSFSQWDRRPDEKGGSGGHAALYIKGVEIDPDYVGKYPRLKLTKELANATSLDDIRKLAENPDWGTGASVDKEFRNVNWVAIPGKTLFLRGITNKLPNGLPWADCNLKPVDVPGKKTLFAGKTGKDQVEYECQVTPGAGDALDKTLDAAYPYFRDVVVDPAFFSQYPGTATKGDALARAIANDGIGTDFGITLAREAYCIRIPMGRQGITSVMDFLNKRNDDAYNAWNTPGGGKDHPTKLTLDNGNVWDGINNNCTHMTHNALAATGMRLPMISFNPLRVAGIPRMGIDLATLPFMIFQIATPANDFISVSLMTNEARLSHGTYRAEDAKEMDPEHIFSNEKERAMVEDPIQGWLPVQPGAMVEPIYQIPQGNQGNTPVSSWENQIFVPHENTMTILDLATIPSFIPKVGTAIANLIRKTPVAPRQAELNYIMDTKNEKNPYTHPLAHIDYYSGTDGKSGVYGDLQSKYCASSSYYTEKTAKGDDFAKFLTDYCGIIGDRLTRMGVYRPEIVAMESKDADAEIATRVGPEKDKATGKLAHLK